MPHRTMLLEAATFAEDIQLCKKIETHHLMHFAELL